MFVIIGLGNPGETYEESRHNVGFMAVDLVNERFGGSFKKGKGPYSFAKVRVRNRPTLLVKPLTYMNLSGQAVLQLIAYFKIHDFSNLLVVLDDFNLPFGTIRLKPSGSAGGQKGLQSILQALKTSDIARLKIGIGSEFQDASAYVLSPFKRREKKALPELLVWTADAIESFIVDGIDIAMNQFNRNIL